MKKPVLQLYTERVHAALDTCTANRINTRRTSHGNGMKSTDYERHIAEEAVSRSSGKWKKEEEITNVKTLTEAHIQSYTRT